MSSALATIHSINPNKYFINGFQIVVQNNNCDLNQMFVNAVIQNNNTIQTSSLVGTPGLDVRSYYGFCSTSLKYGSIYSTGISGFEYPGNAPQSTPSKILVQKLDTNGVLKWVKYYGEANMYYNPMAICATADSGAVISGMRYNLVNPAVPGACEGFVLKIDKDGMLLTTGINKSPAEKTVFKVLPNPADDFISFKTGTNNNFFVEIYNNLGKQVFSGRRFDEEKIPLAELNQGILFFTIRTNDEVIKGKFIKN